MDKFDRIYQLHDVLRDRRTPISRVDLMAKLECSDPTIYRLINILRDTLHAPLKHDDELGGYYYERTAEGGTYELPGLWFNARELHALLVFERLFESLEPGLLREHLQPLSKRIDQLLNSKRWALPKPPAACAYSAWRARPAGEWFQVPGQRDAATPQAATALPRTRTRRAITERTVSPQRIVHYRDNWYWMPGANCAKGCAASLWTRSKML